jgi:hypothetical protein
MVRGPGCPVWVLDSALAKERNQDCLFSNEHPNYLVVKFFDAEGLLKDTAAGHEDDVAMLHDIRDQVRTLRVPVYRSPRYLVAHV